MKLEKTSGYMPQLDGLRTLAVGGVLWFHLSPIGRHFWDVSLGEMGVQLFFVLSGFLITGILLDARLGSKPIDSTWYTMRHFYARRALRLLPLLYLVLILVVWLEIPPIAASWYWHSFYLTNVYQWLYVWEGYGSHLWSLSVEEQFYFGWPFLILLLSRRTVLPAIILLILIAPLFRYFIWSVDSIGDPNRLPFGVFDCLGMGAMIAYVSRGLIGVSVNKLALGLLIVGVFGVCLVHYFEVAQPFNQTFWACIFAWLVWKASIGFDGMVGRFLLWRPVRYIGKISYGVYVIHGFATAFWYWWLYQASVPGYRVFERLNISSKIYEDPIVPILANLSITFLFAALSWHLFESPINALRRYFPYTKESPTDDSLLVLNSSERI